MLVIDVSVNRVKLADCIMIQRMTNYKNGINKYQIAEPRGFEKKSFRHKYSDGYLPLLKQVIDYLIEHGYNPKNDLEWKKLYEAKSIFQP